MLTRRSISNEKEPCVIHTTHSPVTVFNELHHVFPEYLQKRVWGKTKDKTLVSTCSTGHNTVHGALTAYLVDGKMPAYAVGKTRELVLDGANRYKKAMEEAQP